MFHEMRSQNNYLSIRVATLGNSVQFTHWYWMQFFIHRQNIIKTCSIKQSRCGDWRMRVHENEISITLL